MLDELGEQPSGRGIGSQALREMFRLARSFRAARIAIEEDLCAKQVAINFQRRSLEMLMQEERASRRRFKLAMAQRRKQAAE